MKFKITFEVTTVIGLFLCSRCLEGFGFDKAFKRCEETMASIMCDEFLAPAASCADLMPKEEQNIFFECAAEKGIEDSSAWDKMLKELCSKSDTAQLTQDIMFCWNDKMNATVDEMADDEVYPLEHFICKGDIYKKAVSKLSCPCQIQMGSFCSVSSLG